MSKCSSFSLSPGASWIAGFCSAAASGLGVVSAGFSAGAVVACLREAAGLDDASGCCAKEKVQIRKKEISKTETDVLRRVFILTLVNVELCPQKIETPLPSATNCTPAREGIGWTCWVAGLPHPSRDLCERVGSLTVLSGNHSSRRALAGSSAAARRAGIHDARAAIIRNSSTMPANVAGS